MSSRLSRIELYELVWSEPMRSLARKFNVSDVRLGKICRQEDIPLPGVGYWAKRAAGKSVMLPPMPRRALGQSDLVAGIAVGLLVAGEWAYRSRRIEMREWHIQLRAQVEEGRRREQKERERVERERRLKAERARRNRLLAAVGAWRKALEVREDVRAVLAVHQARSADQPLPRLVEWAAWALAEADRIDPLRFTTDRLLATLTAGEESGDGKGETDAAYVRRSDQLLRASVKSSCWMSL